MLNFVKDIVSDLEVDSDRARVAVITWSNSARVEFELDTYSTNQVNILKKSLKKISLISKRKRT